jgi:tetratricopeptide (TPR) repeat protein
VYSLGVLLGEQLAGRHSSNKAARAAGAWKSKSVGRTVAGNGSTGTDYEQQKTSTKNEQLPSAELENIVAMARREDPTRRYSSAALLAEDVQRFLDGRTIRAQKDSFSYRAGKFIQRNKITVGALTLVIVSLVVGFAVALWQANVARRERARAEGRFTDVRQLSNALLFEIAPKIERLEGSTEAREALVKRALDYLDSLARESHDDTTLQSELAAAYEKVGDLQGMPRHANLGDFNGAMASYEKARQIRQGLLAAHPNDFELRKNLAANLSALSFIRWWQSDVSGALIDSEKSLNLYGALLAEKPDLVELQLAAAETRLDRANIFYFNDQIAETYPPLRTAIAALETLRQANPEDAETLRLLSKGETILALTLRFDDKVKEGEIELAKAFVLSEALAARHPHDPVQKQGLLYTYQQGSQFYQEVDDARGFEIQLKAVKVAEDAARTDTANTQACQNLAKSYSLMGLLALRLKKLDEAVLHLDKSAATFAELEKLEPKNRTYKHDIARVLTFLGLAQFERRDFTGALASYAKAAALYEDDVRADPKNIFPVRKLASVHTYIGDAHRDYAKTLGGQLRQTHLQSARENHQRALDIFMQLEAQNALAENDRKYVEELRTALAQYERQK